MQYSLKISSCRFYVVTRYSIRLCTDKQINKINEQTLNVNQTLEAWALATNLCFSSTRRSSVNAAKQLLIWTCNFLTIIN
ncbi:hypothetical protein BpHYR1_025523 [Brachionus plicatilis]|uniref:Uncharacterized protein n=1 Tax=Brachionus plicatilis TaxID=10195 RepID=A0A3M7RBL8_BRAPC|nr:hypothetical protein BpHYR1_025523 [Brachionus plicatilis]